MDWEQQTTFSPSSYENGAAVAVNPVSVDVETLNKPDVDILRKAVVLCLTIRVPGIRKKVKGVDIKTADDFKMPDDQILHIAKDLFDAPEMKEVKQHVGRIRQYVQSLSLPCHFKAGMYAVPVGLVDEVDGKIQTSPNDPARGEMERIFWQLVDQLIAALPLRYAEAQERLGSLYNAADYPSPTEMRNAFGMEVKYLDFGVPGTLKEISRSIWQREQEKAVKTWQDEAGKIRDAMREGMAGLVEHMVHCLSMKEDGKPVIFHDTLVTNMSGFLKSFPAKNDVIGDEELARLVNQASDLLNGVEADTLRKDLDTRERLRLGFAAIQTQLTDHLQVKPRRKLRLKDAGGEEGAQEQAAEV